jgi:hypothetical protein
VRTYVRTSVGEVMERIDRDKKNGRSDGWMGGTGRAALTFFYFFISHDLHMHESTG